MTPQAFTARWLNIIRPAPDVNLLFTPFLPCIVLVQTCQVTVVALVQGLVAGRRQACLVQFLQHDRQGSLRPVENTGEGEVEPLLTAVL